MTTDVAEINTHSALKMAELGWQLVPIRTREKNPGGLLGDGWQHQASADSAQIESWIRQYSACNWGVLLGPSSGIIDIEYDSEEGRVHVEAAVHESGVLTPTYRSDKSDHRLYKHDERMAADSATVVKAYGVEFRFGNGKAAQSVVPPSIHPSGAKYQWLPGLSPDDVEVARLPDCMWKLMQDLRQRKADEKQKERDANRKTTPIVPCAGNHEIGVHTTHVAAAEFLIEQAYSWHQLLFEFGWKECSETIFTRPGDDWSNHKSAELCLEGPGVPGLQVWTNAAPVDPGRYGKFRFWLHSKGYTDDDQIKAAKAFLGHDRSKQVDAAFFEVKTGTPDVDLDGILNAKTEAAVASRQYRNTIARKRSRVATEVSYTTTDGFREIETIRFMALPYDIEDNILLSTWSQIKSDPEHEIRTENSYLLPTCAIGELQSWLDDPEVDDLENSRPDAYKIGWRSACDRIAVVDATFDTLPDFVSDDEIPPNVGDLLEYAENEVERLRSERKLAFLTRGEWTDESRCEHWTWKGRESCCRCACRFLNVDNDIPSIDLSKILRKHRSVQKMNKFIEEHRQEKHVQSRGAINKLVQEYSQRLRANDAVENIIAHHKKRGAK